MKGLLRYGGAAFVLRTMLTKRMRAEGYAGKIMLISTGDALSRLPGVDRDALVPKADFAVGVEPVNSTMLTAPKPCGAAQ